MADYAEVLVKFHPTADGGRHTVVFLGENAPAPYRPHFRVHGGVGEYLAVEFVEGPEEAIAPGCEVVATVEFLAAPRVSYVSLIIGTEFDICEGGRVVGSGKVTRR